MLFLKAKFSFNKKVFICNFAILLYINEYGPLMKHELNFSCKIMAIILEYNSLFISWFQLLYCNALCVVFFTPYDVTLTYRCVLAIKKKKRCCTINDLK